MAAKFPPMNATPAEITDNNGSINPNTTESVNPNDQFQALQERLDTMSDQMLVMKHKLLRLKKALENLRGSDE